MTNAVEASCRPAHTLVFLGGHLTISLLSQEGLSRAGPGKQGPGGPAQTRPATHLQRCSHCPQGCWSSCGPWWMTQRTQHRDYSQYNPCPRLFRHPSGLADPERKWRGPKKVAYGFFGHFWGAWRGTW